MKTMLKIERNDKMNAALERCKEVHPKVRRVSASTVTVIARGRQHSVTFAEPKPGLRLALCDCLAGQNGRLCYHIPAALGAASLPATALPIASGLSTSHWPEMEQAILVKPKPKGETYGGIDI